MSGAQGAHPVGQTTPTTYESVGGGENRTRTDVRSREDQGAIQIEKVQDKVDDAAGWIAAPSATRRRAATPTPTPTQGGHRHRRVRVTGRGHGSRARAVRVCLR